MSTIASPEPAAPPKRPPVSRGEWTPHFWVGCDAFAWYRLLVQGRFAVHPSQWYVAGVASVVSPVHTALRLLQTIIYGKEIARTRIEKPPVFIIGHWRSGTTLLHELLIRDPRHAFPTTYECLLPHHFVISRSWLPKLLWWMMPSRRPMDNMPAGWDRPQEDELALCLMGQPSPYRQIAFPNQPAEEGALDLQGLSRPIQDGWKVAFLRFIREVTLVNRGRRLILKSPPHTWRIPMLLEMFPDARFVHIVRDPYVVFASTVNLWKSLYRNHGLQKPMLAALSEMVLDRFVAMHERLEESKRLIPPGRFCELRYEDLVRQPIRELQTIYRDLELGDFEPARKLVEHYLDVTSNYEKNRYDIDAGDREAIERRWGHIIRRYGYG